MPTSQFSHNETSTLSYKADILIVDDALPNLQILFSMLTEHGYEVRGAQNGASALMMATAVPPDLILLDVRMPDMDGYTVCEKLKTNPQTAQIPVIFISALDELADKIRGFQVGGVDYITKPFQIEEVLTRIQTHLSLYKLHIQLDTQNIQLQQEIAERKQAETNLQQLNEELEARVSARTADLTTTNTALLLEIANRKQAQKTLRREEKRYRQMFEMNQAVKLIIDPDNGRIVEANQAACHFYGYSQEEITSMAISDINIISDTAIQLEMNKAKAETRLFFSFKHQLASGEIRDVEVYSGPLATDENILLYSIIHDVTQRKQAEEALKESEIKFRTMFEASLNPTGVSIGGVHLLVNSAYLQMFGYDHAEELVGTSILGCIAPSEHEKIINHNSKREQGSDAPTAYETYGRRKDGSEFNMDVHVSNYTLNGEMYTLAILRDITERKQAELALQKSEERYRGLYNSIRDAILVAGTQRNIIHCNPALTTMFGYTLEELLEIQTIDIYEDEHEFLRVGEILKNFPEDETILITINFKKKTGEVFQGETSIFEIKNDDGEIIGFIGLIRDITKHKKAEESLRQLSQAIEQSPASVVITDTEGAIQYVNPKFSQVTGYSKAEAIGKNPRILKSENAVTDYKTLWDTISAGQIWHGEFHNKKKNGDTYWESAIVSPIIDEAEQITHYLAIKEDITEQKMMRDQLQERNRQLQLLNRASQVIGSSLDLDKILVIMLEETRHLLGVIACSVWLLDTETGELVCEQVTDPGTEIVRGWRLAPEQGIAGWVATHGESVIVPNLQIDPRHFNGVDEQTGLSIHSMMTVPLWVKQEVIGVFQVVDEEINRFSSRDLQLTESLAIVAANAIENARLHEDVQTQLNRLKMMQARLIQSEKLAAIGELISGIAHELNNPLAATILYAQLLQAKGVDAEVSKDLDQIVTQAHRASMVVRGLLDFARQRPFERSETQVNDVLKSTVDLLAYEIRTHNIDIIEHLVPDLPITLADPHQLQQVFVNLLTNAIQAMDKSQIGGQLTITSEVGKPDFVQETNSQALPVIRVMIKNDGPCIPTEIQSRIFDPFFTTKAPGNGTGLGLSVCHGIISEHNGDIWVKSKLGEGTTFFIELPIVDSSKKEIPNHKKQLDLESASLPNGKSRILVVDDEQSILMVITRILRRNGYLVDEACDGVAALKLLETATYDLILCDLRMPEMSGPEFYWNAVEKYPEIESRVIFTTGDTVSSHTREFLDSVKAQYLLKPFELDSLITVVQEWFAS